MEMREHVGDIVNRKCISESETLSLNYYNSLKIIERLPHVECSSLFLCDFMMRRIEKNTNKQDTTREICVNMCSALLADR